MMPRFKGIRSNSFSTAKHFDFSSSSTTDSINSEI